MTAREMQIEMERRIQLIDPTLILDNKVTSDTLFSFLNAYTKRYVKQIYLLADNINGGTRAQKNSIDSIKSLITRDTLEETNKTNSDANTKSFILPDDYFLYIRSNSIVTSTYRDASLATPQTIPNELIEVEDAASIITTPYNQIILRNPQVIMHTQNNNTCLHVIHDKFTTITQVDLVYYRLPKEFNVNNVDGTNIIDCCELPESTHMEIVEGAVEMFITENKYRLNVKQDKQ